MSIPGVLQNYAMRLGFPQSETLARIFEIIYDGPDDLKILEALPGRVPELVERTGFSEEKVRELIHRLIMRGAMSISMKEPDVFRLFPAMIELRDSTVLWPDAPQELVELWDRLVLNETGVLIPVLKKMNVAPIVRVIPVDRTIESQNTVLDVDTARNIFKGANLITVIPCVCRTVARKNGRGQDCPAPENSVCMQTNLFAMGIMSRGLGQKISEKEALKRVGDAEDAGLVHMVRNNIKNDMFMCNCCSCCCSGLYFVNQLDYPQGVSPSRFRIKFDADSCSGCGDCVDRCQFHAIELDGDLAKINLDRCYGCGNCAITCPSEALSLEEVRPLEHIRVK